MNAQETEVTTTTDVVTTRTSAWFESLPKEIREWEDFNLLSQDQFLAIQTIVSGDYKVVNLLGRAGSGKTFTVKLARRLLEALGFEVRVCGTTGVASQNAGGESTLNSLFRLGVGNYLPKGLTDFVGGGRKQINTAISKATQNFSTRVKGDLVLFIDEVSMASSELLVLVYQVLSAVCLNRNFRIVLVGDLRQLLPVDKEDDRLPWKDKRHLFFEPAEFIPATKDDKKNTGKEPKVYTYGSMVTDGPFQMNGKESILPQGMDWTALALSLTTNHRQKTDAGKAWFIEALNALGDGANFNDARVAPLLQRVWFATEDGDYVNYISKEPLPEIDGLHIYTKNREVGEENARALANAKGKIVKYSSSIELLQPGYTMDECLSDLYPLEADMELAVGLKFMVRLNLTPELLNGTIGEIIELRRNPDVVVIRLPDGTVHEVGPTDIPMPSNADGPLAAVHMIPGHLSHAMTPWKAQGLTIREPLIYHLNTYWKQHGLLYVVCSRVTEPDLLYILVDDMKMLNKAVHCDPKVGAYIRKAELNTARLLSGQALIPEMDYEATFTDEGTEQVAHVLTFDKASRYCFFFKHGEMVGINRDAGGQWVRVKLDDEVLKAVEDKVDELGLIRSVEAKPLFWTIDNNVVTFGPYSLWLQDYEEVTKNMPVTKPTVVKTTESVVIYRIGDVHGMMVTDQQKLSNKLYEDSKRVEWFANISFIWFHPES
jgi:hypothetical protein